MAALGFILNAVGIGLPVAFEIANAIPKPFEHKTILSFQMGDGNATHPLKDAGGTIPHISLFDDDGQRIGQYKPSSKEKIAQAESGTVAVKHNDNGNKAADPYYVLLSQFDGDAVCISSVQVSNGVISATFYGDTGHYCGQDWFYSSKRVGTTFAMPKCVWLDGNNSYGLNARAMSFHLNDMIPSPDKLAMYAKNKDYLCKSTRRFSYWGSLLPDSRVPFFKPRLQYNIDEQTGGEGADVDPDRAVDERVFDKSVYMYILDDNERGLTRKRSKRTPRENTKEPRAMIERRTYNKDPSHLIITEIEEQSAKELCEHPNSFGWDFVSTHDKLYCDMSEKTLYALCDGEVKGNCFDLERKVLVGHGGINARGIASTIGVPEKKYKTHKRWTK